MDYTNLAFGAVGGIGWSLVRFYREKQKNEKIEFDGKKFFKTLIEGGIVGLIAGVYGIDFEMALALPIYGGITGVVDTVVNIIWGFFTK